MKDQKDGNNFLNSLMELVIIVSIIYNNFNPRLAKSCVPFIDVHEFFDSGDFYHPIFNQYSFSCLKFQQLLEDLKAIIISFVLIKCKINIIFVSKWILLMLNQYLIILWEKYLAKNLIDYFIFNNDLINFSGNK